MVEDMITLLESTVQPELRKGRYPDKKSHAGSPRSSRLSPANWTPDPNRVYRAVPRGTLDTNLRRSRFE